MSPEALSRLVLSVLTTFLLQLHRSLTYCIPHQLLLLLPSSPCPHRSLTLPYPHQTENVVVAVVASLVGVVVLSVVAIVYYRYTSLLLKTTLFLLKAPFALLKPDSYRHIILFFEQSSVNSSNRRRSRGAYERLVGSYPPLLKK